MNFSVLIVYSTSLATFILLDLVWLGWLAKSLYQKHLGFVMADKVNWPAAIVFYLLFIAGLLFFVTYPGVQTDSIQKTALYGAFFGIITYGTYELTNWAVLTNWPPRIVLIDIAWGAFICAMVAMAGYYVAKLV